MANSTKNKKIENIKSEEVHKGLTYKEVEERIKAKLTNKPVKAPSKSVAQIIFGNIFTYFNLIFVLLSVLLISVHSYRDLTFMVIIIANMLIGTVQELRSKRVLDKMKMLTAPYALVVRNGEENLIMADDLVKDDVVNFNAGDQICADAVVLEGEAFVNESLLTGEPDEIRKAPGDKLMSGSFVVSGNCYAKLTEVGAESYISKLTIEAKKMKTGEQSEMIRSLNKIVKLAGIAIIPIGLILFSQQFFLKGEPLQESVQAMVAAVIGMIPEGLFLLASLTLAISAMKLAKNKVLLHEMKSIETLARVDVLCVDKTGTITDTEMKVSELIKLDKCEKTDIELRKLIGDFTSAQKADNITMQAMKDYFTDSNNVKEVSVSGFSSQYKYSGVQFENESYVLGAPEFVLKEKYDDYKTIIEKYSKRGQRVLVFGKYNGIPDGKDLTEDVIPYGLVTIENPVRENAVETFKYFAEQGVEIKVISGDNPVTVSEVAKKAKIANAEKYVDASKLKTDEEIEKAVAKYTVFGRVTPQQKRKFVQALKKQGRTVAMTGDGVNDVLALKDADCSVAMASGSQAAVQASQLVLLESDFSKMPDVVEEGRRVVNNLECSGSLFLVKNIFSFLISLLSICVGLKYPIRPAHVSLISAFTIGLPAFLLSQAPNTELIKGRFLGNILSRAIPGGITDALLIAMLVFLGQILQSYSITAATVSTVVIAVVGLMVVNEISKPMTRYKWCIWGLCAIGMILSFSLLKNLFSLTYLSIQETIVCIVFALFAKPFLIYTSKGAKKIADMIEEKIG